MWWSMSRYCRRACSAVQFMRSDVEIRIGAGIRLAYDRKPASDRCAILQHPMKHRFASIAGILGGAALLVVGCGGSDFQGPSGGSGTTSGGTSSGTAGKPSAGSESGGAEAGSPDRGGSESGGSESGGTASGGT